MTPKKARIKGITRPIDYLIVHYTATPADMEVNADMVDQWHKQRGWNGIGYHFLIARDGTVEVGRDIAKAGAHCQAQNRNYDSIGICYAGGLDDEGNGCDNRTPEQKVALRAVLTALKAVFQNARICGHRDFSNTGCPGFDAEKEFKDISDLYE